MLETYVQELGAAEIWTRFSLKIRTRVRVLGDLFRLLLELPGDAMAANPSALDPSPPTLDG